MAKKDEMQDTGRRAVGEAERAGEEQTSRAAEAGRRGVEQTVRAGEQATRVGEEQVSRMTAIGREQSDQLRSALTSSVSAYRDIAEFSRGDFDAVMQSNARLMRGMQEMGWEMANFTQESLRLGLRAANELMSCRTMDDMVKVQRDYTKQSVDAFLNESAKLLEMSSSAAGEAVNPIQQRVEGK